MIDKTEQMAREAGITLAQYNKWFGRGLRKYEDYADPDLAAVDAAFQRAWEKRDDDGNYTFMGERYCFYDDTEA